MVVNNLSNPKMVSVNEALPLVEKRVIVVCSEFRALGYLDKDGKWREDRRPAEPMNDVIGWYPAEEA